MKFFKLVAFIVVICMSGFSAFAWTPCSMENCAPGTYYAGKGCSECPDYHDINNSSFFEFFEIDATISLGDCGTYNDCAKNCKRNCVIRYKGSGNCEHKSVDAFIRFRYDPERRKYIFTSGYGTSAYGTSESYDVSASYYIDVSDDPSVINDLSVDICKECPTPQGDNWGNLYSFYRGSNDDPFGAESCTFKLSKGNCNTTLSNVKFGYDNKNNGYVRKSSTVIPKADAYVIDTPSETNLSTDYCQKCPTLGETGQENEWSNLYDFTKLSNLNGTATDYSKSSCAVKLARGDCKIDALSVTSVVYKYDNNSNKYSRKTKDIELKDNSYYINDEVPDNVLSDYCLPCPVPPTEQQEMGTDGFGNPLYTFNRPDTNYNANGIDSCRLQLSRGYCDINQTSVYCLFDNSVSKYLCKKVAVTPRADAKRVDNVASDQLVDYCKIESDFPEGSCNSGRCVDNNGKCIFCPAGYACPAVEANDIYCKDAEACGKDQFSLGGASKCSKCATGYTTDGGTAAGLCLKDDAVCTSEKACQPLNAKFCAGNNKNSCFHFSNIVIDYINKTVVAERIKNQNQNQ